MVACLRGASFRFFYFKKPGKPKKVAKRGGTEGKGGLGKICLKEEKKSEKKYFFPLLSVYLLLRALNIQLLFVGRDLAEYLWRKCSFFATMRFFDWGTFSTYREKVPYFLPVCSFWLLSVEPISINSSRPKMKEAARAGIHFFTASARCILNATLELFVGPVCNY